MADRVTTTLAFETAFGTIGVTATNDGVCRVQLRGSAVPREEACSAAAAAHAHEAVAQLGEYLGGTRRAFELPLDWRGLGERHRRVLEALCEAAPFGRTVTYGELARRSGEDDPREIGIMMARNPLPLVVPCHRVVASDGLGGYGGGIELKRRLLEFENVLPLGFPLAGPIV